ncbi:MAG: aspartate 1-decarboxylase [Cytophagales bacterium]|nr:MAG: aspartate 1-decarboxylase [Cytophagales bacterium]
MYIEVIKSKIHRIKITQAELHYVGSITIDEDLLDAANMIENEKVQVLNLNNGERLETYIIKGKRGSGVVCMNGPAARKMQVGDVVIVISYASMDFNEAKTWKPSLVFPEEGNKLNK